MWKCYLLLIVVFSFFTDSPDVFALSGTDGGQKVIVKQTENQLLARKRKKRRKKKKIRRKRKKKSKSSFLKRRARGYPSQWFYGMGGAGYFMPSSIDFQPVVDAGSSGARNAEVTHTGGVGMNLGFGYRWKYLAGELQLFFVYPAIVGSEVTFNADGYEGVTDSAKVLIPRIFGKFFLNVMRKVDVFVGGGVGTTQILKDVSAEQEGIALGGLSFHGVAGGHYYIDRKLFVTFSAEYSMIKHTYVDLWQEQIYDSAEDESVSLSQTMILAYAGVGYRF